MFPEPDEHTFVLLLRVLLAAMLIGGVGYSSST